MGKKYPDAVEYAIASVELCPPRKSKRPNFTDNFEKYGSLSVVKRAQRDVEVHTFYNEMVVEHVNSYAVLVWSIYDRCAYGPDGGLGSRFVTASPLYRAAPGSNADVCPYCGTDNGDNSEYRIGIDCYQCGGN